MTRHSRTIDESLADMDPGLAAGYPAFKPLFDNWPFTAVHARKVQAILMPKVPPCGDGG
jgi:hypothetical protein